MRRSMPVIFSITFVRHGETTANKEHRIQGHLDIPLSSTGEKQATLAGTSLCKQRFTRVYASDLRRAYSTCEHILEQNTCMPPPIKVDTRLRERNFGSVEGLHIDEVKTMAAAEGLSWPQFNPPGAETLGVLQERMVSFFRELCQSVYDKNKPTKSDSVDNGEAEDFDRSENLKVDNGEAEDFDRSENLKLLQGSPAVENVLVVSHGAALKQFYIHLHKSLGCPLPADQDVLNRISPNTGISEYTIQFAPKKYKLHCLRIHDDHHLQALS